jgi:hypothetical protein
MGPIKVFCGLPSLRVVQEETVPPISTRCFLFTEINASISRRKVANQESPSCLGPLNETKMSIKVPTIDRLFKAKKQSKSRPPTHRSLAFSSQ